MMKKFYLIFILLAISYQGITQQISHDVVSSTGNEAQNATIKLSWTLGEISTLTLENSSVILTEGFQQANLFLVSTRNIEDKLIAVKSYPNPFTHYVNIQKDTDETLFLECVDMLGRTLKTVELVSTVETVNLERLANAMYLLKITNSEGQLIELIKVQKH